MEPYGTHKTQYRYFISSCDRKKYIESYYTSKGFNTDILFQVVTEKIILRNIIPVRV